MNPEQQRIAIAEACGLKLFPMGPSDKQWLKNNKDGGVEQVPLPDYLNDLNAMHEAEKLLSNKEKEVYAVALHDICGNVPFWFGIAHATAAQKAEAFLKACNLWEGNDKL